MSFDWSEYLYLAEELAGQTTIPASQQARLRDAISRAYYAAFISSRNHLRDRERHSIPTTADSHKYVSEQFEQSLDAVRRAVGENLKLLRLYRNQADYVDDFPGLPGITRSALRRSNRVISNLSVL